MKARFSLLLALAACVPTRPDGSYTPKVVQDGPSGFESPDASRDADQTTDPGADEDITDDPEPDAGEMSGDDGGAPDPLNPLAPLEGKYLMRVDYYSTVSEMQAGTTLTIKNRLSNLLFVELTAADGKLHAREQLCSQNYYHQCASSSCKSWTTTVDPTLNTWFPKRVVERDYAVDAQRNLSAELALMPVGYDSDAPSVTTIPTRQALGMIWDYRTSSEPGRIGVRTRIVATLNAGIDVPLDCEVSQAQLFATKFAAQLPALDKASLTGLRFDVDVSGQGLNAVYVHAWKDGANVCTFDQITKPRPSNGSDQAVARFKSAGKLTGCPANADAFDSAFPASPATM
ncbi:MAG TPA: hypothetical protein VI299_11060 [Polyangiales bacterium]